MPNSSDRRKKRIGSIAAALFVLFYILPLVVGSVFAAVEFLRDGEAFAAVLFLLILIFAQAQFKRKKVRIHA